MLILSEKDETRIIIPWCISFELLALKNGLVGKNEFSELNRKINSCM